MAANTVPLGIMLPLGANTAAIAVIVRALLEQYSFTAITLVTADLTAITAINPFSLGIVQLWQR